MSGKPTVKAVIAYADVLRVRAERQMIADVYAQPYYPTTHTARTLASRMGPEKALEYLARRSLEVDRARREQNERADRSDKRHVRRQKEFARDLEAARNMKSLGKRIDDALNALSTVGTPAAMSLDSDRVHGSKTPPPPRFPGDPTARARAVAREAARFCEEELEDAKRRRVERDAA